MNRPRRARRAPQRYEPQPDGPFEDDLTGSDAGSDTGSDTESDTDTESSLSGFIVSDEECLSEETETSSCSDDD